MILPCDLGQSAYWEPMNIDKVRHMVAEELAGRSVASETATPADVDVEKKYGAKLDRTLGGLAAGRADENGE